MLERLVLLRDAVNKVLLSDLAKKKQLAPLTDDQWDTIVAFYNFLKSI